MTRADFERTRRSLVERLPDWRDHRGWQRFFDTYARLIHRVARRAGLTEEEAQDVVQETFITVAKNAGAFRYDPATGSFKGWLLHITRWRIADQFRKRPPSARRSPPTPGATRRTATIERLPDPAGGALEAAWDEEWRTQLASAALARLRSTAKPKQFQIFDCYVVKAWPAAKVAQELGVNIARVYLVKHRLSAQLKKEVAAIEKEALPPPSS